MATELEKYPEIGERIKDRILELDLIYEEVAQGVGVHRQTVQAWARGYQRPEGVNLLRLAGVLKVTPSTILGEEGDVTTSMADTQYVQALERFVAEVGRGVAELEELKRLRAQAGNGGSDDDTEA